MTSEYDKYFQKAVSAVSQAKSTDGTGYTENFYSNLLNDQLIKTPASYMSETARASALQRVKASTGLSKGALLREFNRQISTGEVTVSEAV
jgi:hypothetical protein